MIISEGIWLLDASKGFGPMPGFHCYLVRDEEGLTLIDTSLPGKAKAILKEIGKLGFQESDLKRIFLTHTDMDHIGNARELQQATGCKVYVSAEEQKYLTGETPRLPFKEKMFEKAHFTAPETELYPEHIPGYQIIPTPGHTKGHVAVLYKDCLFAGDCVSTEAGKVTPPGAKFT